MPLLVRSLIVGCVLGSMLIAEPVRAESISADLSVQFLQSSDDTSMNILIANAGPSVAKRFTITISVPSSIRLSRLPAMCHATTKGATCIVARLNSASTVTLSIGTTISNTSPCDQALPIDVRVTSADTDGILSNNYAQKIRARPCPLASSLSSSSGNSRVLMRNIDLVLDVPLTIQRTVGSKDIPQIRTTITINNRSDNRIGNTHVIVLLPEGITYLRAEKSNCISLTSRDRTIDCTVALDVNNCNRCTLQYVGTDSQRCSPASCEGNTTVRTCSNGTILYPVCSRQNDGRCLRVTPECPTDTNPTYSNANYSTNNYYTNQRIFPLPLSNCSTTPPVELPNCQYICSNNDIGRCPICRYSCSSYSTFAAQPLTSPTQSILFPWPDRPHTMPGVGVFSG
jgi:hypothetical protein